MGRLRVTGNTQKPRKVMATLGHRLNYASNTTVSCWMVQHNGGALIDGNITNYLIRRKSKETENTVHDNDIEEDETVDTSDLNNLYQIETETDSETDEETTDKDTQSNVLE